MVNKIAKMLREYGYEVSEFDSRTFRNATTVYSGIEVFNCVIVSDDKYLYVYTLSGELAKILKLSLPFYIITFELGRFL